MTATMKVTLRANKLSVQLVKPLDGAGARPPPRPGAVLFGSKSAASAEYADANLGLVHRASARCQPFKVWQARTSIIATQP